MFLPFGLVPDINGTNPLAAINGATVTSSGIAPLPAVIALAA